MKTKNFYQLSIKAVALLLVFMAFSCSDSVEDLEIDGLTAYTLPESLKSGISHVNGMVAFESESQFAEISQALMEESDRYLLDYINSLGSDLTDDEVNDIMYETNFNHFLVFETYEKYHGITSLRSILKDREDAWMDNEELIGDNPGEYPITEETLPFTNPDGEYMIGSTIMHIKESGLAYEILNKDFEALNMVRSGAFELNENITSGARLASNVIVHNPELLYQREENTKTAASCKLYARASGTYKNHSGSNYKMYWILDSDYEGLYSVTKSKVYVKKKRLGKYSRFTTSLFTSFRVRHYEIGCTDTGVIRNEATKRKWALYATAKKTLGKTVRVSSNGTFYGGFDSGKHNKIVRTYGVH